MCARLLPMRSRLWLVPVFCIFLSPHLGAQTGNEPTGSSDRPKSIEESLTDSLETSAKLRQALKERKLSRIDLEIAFAALKEQSEASRQKLQNRINELTTQLQGSVSDSDNLRAEIKRLTDLLIASKTESDQLSKAFDDYRAEMKAQVRELARERDALKIAAIVAAAAAAGLGILAAVK